MKTGGDFSTFQTGLWRRRRPEAAFLPGGGGGGVIKTSKVASDPPPTSPFFATLPPAEIQKFDSTFDFSHFGKSKNLGLRPLGGYECVQ